MAKIVTEAIVISVNRIAPNNVELESVVTDELIANIEAVVSELLADAAAVVEVEKVNG